MRDEDFSVLPEFLQHFAEALERAALADYANTWLRDGLASGERMAEPTAPPRSMVSSVVEAVRAHLATFF